MSKQGKLRRSNDPAAKGFPELAQLIGTVRRHMPELRESYKVRSLGMFGSYTREHHKEESDLDMLVDFEEAPSLFEFLALKNYLSDLLEIEVDLVMKGALRPAIGRHILEEVIYI